MDRYLLDYVRSGKAWLVVGSGPSIEMGYPTWGELAAAASKATAAEAASGFDQQRIRSALNAKRYPSVFEEAEKGIGAPRLLQVLQESLQPRKQQNASIYEKLARWPIPVYLTTNYDDEIQRHLSAAGEAYISYDNCDDHLAYLLPEATGIIAKLHGDLRSRRGLVLTESDYRDIATGSQWAGWRTRLTSIFQMNRVVVIGHSLEDPHVRHVLEAAKQGAGVLQPVCWIAPDVPRASASEYLERFRIRVISYDNRDGQHQQLARLIDTVTNFVPPRVSVHIKAQVNAVASGGSLEQAAAPAFFVFNKLIGEADFDDKRLDVLVAAILAGHRALLTRDSFTVDEALGMAGWPTDTPISEQLKERVVDRATSARLLVRKGDRVCFSEAAAAVMNERQRAFEHMRQRFRLSTKLRIRRLFPAVGEADAERLAMDVDAALVGFYRDCGLALAGSQVRTTATTALPMSIARFLSEASARYDDLLHRQAFTAASIDIFVSPDLADREYLGRLSQGFFGFHALGVFGEVAAERFRLAAQSVWLIDSNAQIPALALAADTHRVFHDCFSNLSRMGVRLFTTERLFDEAREHLWFANRVIEENGPQSLSVRAAAVGDAPFRKGNVFLQGFIRWQAAGNPADWPSYLFQIGGRRDASPENVAAGLAATGIEVIALRAWPGFADSDVLRASEVAMEIAAKRVEPAREATPDIDEEESLRKAYPEAEALLIVENERTGRYHMLSPQSKPSPAWFISNTSHLNLIATDRVTMQPDAFVRFASTLGPGTDTEAAERAFETIVWSVAEAGLSVLDDRAVEVAFARVIDEATVNLEEQRVAYDGLLRERYGESVDAVLERLGKSERPLVALQLANEAATVEAKKRADAERELEAVRTRSKHDQTKLTGVERYLKKMADRKKRAVQASRRAASSPKNSRRRSRKRKK